MKGQGKQTPNPKGQIPRGRMPRRGTSGRSDGGERDGPGGKRPLALVGLLLVFLILSTVYNAVSTPFEAPDEIGHFYYVVHLVQTGRLPVVPAEGAHPHYEHEGAQPPLYYAGAALLVRALSGPLGLDLQDAAEPLEINPHSTCGRPDARYNVAYLAHDPHVERFPYQGRVRVLHVVRLWSSLLGVLAVAGVFAAVRLAFPDLSHAAWLAVGLTAFNPEFLFTAAAVSNDAMVIALSTWGVYLALRLLGEGDGGTSRTQTSVRRTWARFPRPYDERGGPGGGRSLSWLRWLVRPAALGILAGLAALSKFSGALLLPLFGLVILLAPVLRRRRAPAAPPLSASSLLRPAARAIGNRGYFLPPASAFLDLAVCVFAFLAVAGWWFARNWTLYGDLTGTRPILDTLSLRSHMSVGVLMREFPGLFRSWWGVFGCTAPPAGFYLVYVLVAVVGVAGLIVGYAGRARKPQAGADADIRVRRQVGADADIRVWVRVGADADIRVWTQIGVLVVWLMAMGAAYVRWNWAIHASKGRLLYPALVSVTGLLGLGWARWAIGRRWVAWALLGGLAVMAAVVPFAVMAPRVAPPAVYTGTADVQAPHALDGRFGSDIALLGYDLGGEATGAGSLVPGDWIDLTLYWQALGQPRAHHTLAIQLVSAVPGETATLVNFNTWTGGGNYPTGVWQPGEIVADRYRLRLPEDVERAQSWWVQVALFDLAHGARMPFDLAGQPAGDVATLTRLRVGASDPEAQAPAAEQRLDEPVTFGGAISLDGVEITVDGVDTADVADEGSGRGPVDRVSEVLHVTLWWRSIAPLTDDYVVFVHLYDTEGRMLSTADGPPLSGGFPTSIWRPDDRVRDDRSIPLTVVDAIIASPPSAGEGSDSLELGVGWYDAATGLRLPASTADGARLPNDEVLLTTPLVRSAPN